jgi:hypothetical protein
MTTRENDDSRGEQGDTDLRERGAASAVMARCLQDQADATPRSPMDRLLGRCPLHDDARSWFYGAIGELEVARLLDRLDDSWTVLHAVPVGSGDTDIDHVLIGSRGVFTINTKNHSGRRIWATGTGFSVDGRTQRYIHASLHEAGRASDLISGSAGLRVPVTPLLVVVDPAAITGTWPDVLVLPANGLLRWLKRQPRAFADDTVAEIVQAAARRSTWSTGPDECDISQLKTDFDRLRAEVFAARTRRRLWAIAARSAVVAAVVLGALLTFRALPGFVAGLFALAS